MVNALSVLVLWGPCLASAYFEHGNAHELRVWIEDKVGKTEEMPCVSDIPGGRWMAGATMVGGMVVWAAVTVALVYYLVGKRSESLVLPGPAGPSTPANDSPNDAPGAPPTKPQKKKRVYMYSLDGMRTILVTCVIFAHYPIGLPAICKHFLGWPMQFFFVLSGFCAQCATEGQKEQQYTWVSGLTYVARRLARILPLYQLGLFFQYALGIYGNRACQPVLAWPMNSLLLQVFAPVKVCGPADAAWTMGYTHFNGNGPAWFAACIVWFSCIFPLLYNARPKAGGVWMLGFLVALLALRAVPDLVNPKWGNYGGGPHLYAMSPIRLMEYAAGMWAAQIAAEAATRWQGWGGWCWCFDAALVAFVAMVYLSLTVMGSTWMCSGDYHITAICCVVCITARLAAEIDEESRKGVRGALLHRVIESRPLTYLARFSFAAYIFQTSFMSFTDEGQDFWIHRFILLWLFAVFATLYIEEPIIQRVQHVLAGSPEKKTEA